MLDLPKEIEIEYETIQENYFSFPSDPFLAQNRKCKMLFDRFRGYKDKTEHTLPRTVTFGGGSE